MDKLLVRDSRDGDVAAINLLVTRAFPDEDLLPLVNELLGESKLAMSLVGIIDDKVVGHVIFTQCSISGSACKAALLAPLAVDPAWQRQGIGSAIVHEGMDRLLQDDVAVVFVLGDPAYYVRFGFTPDTSTEPPYPLPEEWSDAWQSKFLQEVPAIEKGQLKRQLSVPLQWRRSELWAP